MNMIRPQAILLDLDNTFYPYEEAHLPAQAAVVSRVMQVLGVEKASFNERYQQAREEIKARLEGQAASHSRLLYWQRTLELLGMKTQALMTLELEQTYWHHFMLNINLFPSALAFLQELKIYHMPIVLVTDLTAQIQLRKLVYLKLDDLIDYVVSSEEAGVEKPNPRPFELALKKLALPKGGDIWMIGDSLLNDIDGASKAIGAKTFWRRHAGERVSQEIMPDVSFNHFDELITLIRTVCKDTPV